MMQKHVFDRAGTRFYLLTTVSPGYGPASSPSVLLALPDFHWCLEVSTARPPSSDYLRSKRACDRNRVDCESLAVWLADNWEKVTNPAKE